MKTKRFSYELPRHLIADHPVRPRDHSRLLLLDRASGDIAHRRFFDLAAIVGAGDVLVFNDSKVFPARLLGKKSVTGGAIEVFLIKKMGPDRWQVMLGGKKGAVGLRIEFEKGLTGEIRGKIGEDAHPQLWLIRFDRKGRQLESLLKKIGYVPLPPYIKRAGRSRALKEQYQTVYARHEGSVAAPTAGLHFTARLLARLRARGVQMEHITLHVGLGTFQPVKTERVEDHVIHSELATLDRATARRLTRARREGRRIIAVGTTTVRTLESFWRDGRCGSGSRWTDIFIYPGYAFRAVNAMITNFHLPESSLLMLVAAFAGEKRIRRAYEEAIREKYRFYSFGDAMFIA